MSSQQELLALQPEHAFFIGIDSDGCCFDSMEIKHKECFIPNIIKHWDCQAVSKFARAASEFVNLYSKWRGCNRFPALLMTFDLLDEWADVQARSWRSPEIPSLRDWVKNESKLGNPALQRAVAATNDPILVKTLAWSEEVNRTVEEIVHDLPPFPLVPEVLQRAQQEAEIIVVSGTPGEALQREWEEHGIDRYVKTICGQEVGSKSQMLEWAAKGKYAPDKVLMLGDAPGDLKAAKANGNLFFPVNPGDEARSWERLQNEALDRFFAGTYAGEYEESLIAEFDQLLPERPPWKK
ncbi:MAG: HAD family hydrolase [Armatimonadetes bacterium]|nr:HAD family hydrolase [Armatimonadota bacterium]